MEACRDMVWLRCTVILLSLATCRSFILEDVLPAEQWSTVAILDLHERELTGAIPPEIAKLQALTFLDLSCNNISGSLPSELWDLLNIRTLNLSFNSLVGPIPGQIASLISLQKLDLWNNLLSGSIPSEISLLSELQYLDLAFNQLGGNIPPEFSKLAKLEKLFLNNNQLSGSIPVEVGSLLALTSLSLSSNRLEGSIPTELGDLLGLSTLFLDNNGLSGSVPRELARLQSLEELYLNGNHLSGLLPEELGSLGRLTTLYAYFNLLSGPLPAAFGNLSNLISLDMSNNRLSGRIPPSLAKLDRLSSLFLAGNMLEGPLPNGLEQELVFLTVESMEFGGRQPLADRTWSKLRYLGVSPASRGSELLDLQAAGVPSSCQVVRCTSPVTEIRFWDACFSGIGCIVDLSRTTSRLNRATRKTACLNRISVWLGGDTYRVGFINNDRALYAVFSNSQGVSLNLNTADFLNHIDLGPGGRAYTGVDFSSVGGSNLCSNEWALLYVALIWGGAGAALLTILVALPRARRLVGSQSGGRAKWLISLVPILRLLGTALGLVDLVTDIRVLAEVWGGWPMYPLLASVIAPYLVVGLLLSKAAVTSHAPLATTLSFTLSWPPPAAAHPCQPQAGPGKSATQVYLFWPLMVAIAPFLDIVSCLWALGVVPVAGGQTYSMVSYIEGRQAVEIVTESLPQAFLQTVLYMLGSSRATRLYIDDSVYVPSIVVSAVQVLTLVVQLRWESLVTGKRVYEVLWKRLQALKPVASSQPSLELAKEDVLGGETSL